LARAQGLTATGGASLPPLPLPPERKEDIPIAQRCTLMELTDSKCKWPVGDPRSPEFYFCGGEAIEGLPYCLCHCRRAYRKPGEKEDRDEKRAA
jgi:GcrA cell cycle regulator